jgi:hypothetical protein
MKNRILILTFILISLNSVQAISNSTEKGTKEITVECSGKFNIDGKSYTITLHDVSLWDCARFKVASWFN